MLSINFKILLWNTNFFNMKGYHLIIPFSW